MIFAESLEDAEFARTMYCSMHREMAANTDESDLLDFRVGNTTHLYHLLLKHLRCVKARYGLITMSGSFLV